MHRLFAVRFIGLCSPAVRRRRNSFGGAAERALPEREAEPTARGPPERRSGGKRAAGGNQRPEQGAERRARAAEPPRSGHAPCPQTEHRASRWGAADLRNATGAARRGPQAETATQRGRRRNAGGGGAGKARPRGCGLARGKRAAHTEEVTRLGRVTERRQGRRYPSSAKPPSLVALFVLSRWSAVAVAV